MGSIDEPLSFARFAPCLGTEFEGIDAADGTSFSLVEAQRLGDAGGAPRESFSLVFAASDDRVVDQGSYRLRHPQIGAFEIFLVPIARGAKGLLFEAVFN